MHLWVRDVCVYLNYVLSSLVYFSILVLLGFFPPTLSLEPSQIDMKGVYTIIAIIITISGKVANSYINVVKMNSSTLLQNWFDLKQQCLLQKRGHNSTSITSQSLFKGCSGINTSVSTPYGFSHLPSLVSGRSIHHFCCVEDGLDLIDRGFDEVVEGYEDASQKPILKLLSFLSKSNRSLAILGDSMSVQFYWALLEEIARERLDGELIRDILPHDLIA